MLKVHAAKGGRVEIEHPSTAKQAARIAAELAASGASVTVFDGKHVAMKCNPGKARRHGRAASCYMTAFFKRAIKRGL